jgi:hypothetical protein
VVVPSSVPPEYTWYDVAPALAVHVNTTCALPAVATRFVGAVGAGAFGVAVTVAEAPDAPPPFTATTVNEYAVPLVRLVAVYVVDVVEPSSVLPEYTWYDVAPGLAVQVKTTWALPAVAATFVGAVGAGGCGVAVAAADAADVPPLFTATTVNEYNVPFVNPVAVYVVVVVVPSSVLPEYTWYDVAPVLADHARTTWALPAVATTFVGATGAGACGVALTAVEAGDAPPPFKATIVNEYAVPLVRPVAAYDVAAVVVSNVVPEYTW